MAARVLQISCRGKGREPSREVRKLLRIGWRLSKDAAHGVVTPCSWSSGISVGMPRTVRVIGAIRIQPSTGIASDRVTTSTGRRFASASAHQMSPCRGVTTVHRQSSAQWPGRPTPLHPRFGDDRRSPQRSHLRFCVDESVQSGHVDLVGLRPNGTRRHPRR